MNIRYMDLDGYGGPKEGELCDLLMHGNSPAIAKLLDRLVSKGVLSINEALDIAGLDRMSVEEISEPSE